MCVCRGVCVFVRVSGELGSETSSLFNEGGGSAVCHRDDAGSGTRPEGVHSAGITGGGESSLTLFSIYLCLSLNLFKMRNTALSLFVWF